MRYFLSLFLSGFLAYSSISVSFAQQCKSKSLSESAPILSLIQNSLSSACLLQREQNKCSQLEAELEGADKKNIIQCDFRSIEANKLGNMNLSDCVWNGLKISGEQLLDLSAMPGKTM